MGEIENNETDNGVVNTGSGSKGYNKPTGLVASEIGSTSFRVTWNQNSNVVDWWITYRRLGGLYSSATANTNTYWFSGLEPNTVYEVTINANYGNSNVVRSEILVVKTTQA